MLIIVDMILSWKKIILWFQRVLEPVQGHYEVKVKGMHYSFLVCVCVFRGKGAYSTRFINQMLHESVLLLFMSSNSHASSLTSHPALCLLRGEGGCEGGVAFVIHMKLFNIYLFRRVYISAHSWSSCHQLTQCFWASLSAGGHPIMFNVPVSGLGKKGGKKQVDTATTRPLIHTVHV